MNILKTALVFIIATLLSACGEEYTAAWLEAKYSDKTSNFVTIDSTVFITVMSVKARLDKDSNLIAGIRVPTLVLWGENDIYFPVRNAHRFKDDIKNSQIYTYSNVGHLPMEEVPEISLIHFLSFIKNEEFDYENPSD